MKERKIVVIICIILLFLAIGINYINFYHHDFNFYKSEITINGTEIIEKLYFKPDKQLHTLYRNFIDPLILNPTNQRNYLEIKNVSCSEGAAYTYTRDYRFYTFNPLKEEEILAYTEPNEYGCSFGEKLGFEKNKDYWIESKYNINAENIFLINGKYYIKFIAYSPNKHAYLKKGKNLVINGEANTNKRYFTKDNTIVYIPYNGSLKDKKVIQLNNFKYDSNYLYYLFFILFSLSPCIIFYLSWKYYGEEINEPEILEYISNYPKKRNGWEVAAFFKIPFGQLNQNIISSVILSLYNKKIIDLKIEKSFFRENCYIKILRENQSLDWMEKEFLDILKFVFSNSEKDDFKEGYLNYEKAVKRSVLRYSLPKKFSKIQKRLSEQTKNYVNHKGVLISMGFILLTLILSAFLMKSIILTAFLIFSFIFMFIISYKTHILSKFNKEENYIEYKQWQGFKKYLEGSQSIRERNHKAIMMWEEYLIYAVALGVSKRTIKELKNLNIISEKKYNIYITTTKFSSSIAISGHTAGSGGHGGAGGGGVGGGGGGGR